MSSAVEIKGISGGSFANFIGRPEVLASLRRAFRMAQEAINDIKISYFFTKPFDNRGLIGKVPASIPTATGISTQLLEDILRALPSKTPKYLRSRRLGLRLAGLQRREASWFLRATA